MRLRPRGRGPQEKRFGESGASRQEGRGEGGREGRTERGRGSRPRAEQSEAPWDAVRPPSGPHAWFLRQRGAGSPRGPGRGPLGGVRGVVQRRTTVCSLSPSPHQRLQGALGDLCCWTRVWSDLPASLKSRMTGAGAFTRVELEGAWASPFNRGWAWMRGGVASIDPRGLHYERRDFRAIPMWPKGQPQTWAPRLQRGTVQILRRQALYMILA